jgi:hypothetical protein
MEPVTLWRCSRCQLMWVEGSEAIPGRCAACWREHSIPQGPVILMGRDVKVRVVREYGVAAGLLDRKVRRGLEKLRLGWCPCGFMVPTMCDKCNVITEELTT